MFILGLNAYHGDSSACLVKDGKLIAAIEEERINRIKHWAGLPIESIKFCLKEANISIEEVDFVTLSKDPKARLFDKLRYAVNKPQILFSLKKRASNSIQINNIISHIYEQLKVPDTGKPFPKLKFVEHHRSHNASAFYISPFEESALLSIDGMGDFNSTMLAYGRSHKIKVLDNIKYPHSLGFFYTMMTQYLGFHNYGDEYKVMGLSSYGSPDYCLELRKIIVQKSDDSFKLNSNYFNFFDSGLKMDWEKGSPVIESMYSSYLIKKLGPLRLPGEPITQYHKDIAASVQKVTEEIIFGLCQKIHKRTQSENLCLSGGVAQNSVANGKIIANTSFKNLFVSPACHDAGTSIGSSLYFYHNDLKNKRIYNQNWAYTGASFDNEAIKSFLRSKKINFREYPDEILFETVVNALTNKCVVGWFQGKTEFGPRALGNRSILVDPRRTDAKELLNEKIKRREDFRPFAPSILREHVHDFFVQDGESMYMEKVLQIKHQKRDLIPAVTHIDGTGRLQTVSPESNLRFYNLIHAFYRKTGIPMLLNTSFNENEPIVNSPENALNCFLRTKMDLMVMGNIIIQRPGLNPEIQDSNFNTAKMANLSQVD